MSKKYIFAQTIFTHFWGQYLIFAGNYTLLGILPDFLGVGDVLVRADDHAVLLVHELVHLGTYLLDRGFDLLAVDVDGYPAGAALCHKPLFWQRYFKRPSRLGTVIVLLFNPHLTYLIPHAKYQIL